MKNYIGIKVVGIDNWIWFDKTKVKREAGTFTATGGWGDSGCHIKTFSVSEKHIEGEMESESLMHAR